MSVMPQTAAARRGGTVAWAWQRLTGVFLVVFLGTHFWVAHYSDPSQVIAFDDVHIRVQAALFTVIDYALLALALFHGLNGLRMVLLDYDFWAQRARGLTIFLWVLGLSAFALGARTLSIFIAGIPAV